MRLKETTEVLTTVSLRVLTLWLKKNYNTEKHGEPSWELLAAAVGNPAGGNDSVLAESITRNHEGILTKSFLLVQCFSQFYTDFPYLCVHNNCTMCVNLYGDPLGHTKKQKVRVQTGRGKKRSSREFGTCTLFIVCVLCFILLCRSITPCKKAETGADWIWREQRTRYTLLYVSVLCMHVHCASVPICRSITPCQKARNAS